jgi:hypothetical protein
LENQGELVKCHLAVVEKIHSIIDHKSHMVLNPDPCSKKRTPKYLSNGQMDLFLSFCISDFD